MRPGSTTACTTILDGRGCVIGDVLDETDCQRFIDDAEARGMGEAPITTDHGFVRRPDIRNNDRAMFDDVAAAAELWSKLRPRLPERFLRGRVQGVTWRAVGLNERLRIYRYHPGQTFRWHYDGTFRRNAEEFSLFTVLFYLNAVTRGGATALDPAELVEPAPGRVLLFEHHVLHQGNEVIEGVKYVLRSDVMVRHPAD